MKREHSKSYQEFENLRQRLGTTPSIRSFHVGTITRGADGEYEYSNINSQTREQTTTSPSGSSFIISTPGVQRDGHIIEQDGWRLENYRKNPVFLWCHNQRELPIAKATSVGLASIKGIGRSLVGDIDWETFDFARLVQDQYSRGVLSAVSAGWIPTEGQYEYIKDDEGFYSGIHFKEQELIEFSAVPVPADPRALQREFTSGRITDPALFAMNRVFENAADPDSIFYIGTRREVSDSTKTISIPTITAEDVVAITAAPAEEVDHQRPVFVDRACVSYDEHGECTVTDDSYQFSLSEARTRVAKWAACEAGIDWKKYRQAFLVINDTKADNTDGYMAMHHDVVDDALVLVPRALKRTAQRLSRGDYDIKESDKIKAQEHISREAKAIDWTPPWERSLGRVYETIIASLRDDALSTEDRTSLQAQASSLSSQLFGESKLLESWETNTRELSTALFTVLEGNSECREEKASQICDIVSEFYAKHNAGLFILREIFSITGETSGESLIKWVETKNREVTEQVKSDTIDLDNKLENLLSRINENKITLPLDKEQSTLDNIDMDIESLMSRINSSLFPVAGKEVV